MSIVSCARAFLRARVHDTCVQRDLCIMYRDMYIRKETKIRKEAYTSKKRPPESLSL